MVVVPTVVQLEASVAVTVYTPGERLLIVIEVAPVFQR